MERRGPKRLWMPVIGLLLIVGGALAYSYWPGAERIRMQRVTAVWLAVMGSVAWVGLWFILFSGLRWFTRGLGVLAFAALIFGSRFVVRTVHYDGDMGTPMITWAWEPKQEGQVADHRAKQATHPAPTVSLELTEFDYPEYRNLYRDGVVTGPKIRRDWSREPKLLWKQPCGEGYAGFCVVGEAAFTIEQRGDKEVVVAYHAPSGRELWTHAYSARFAEVLGGDGPRSTPTFKDGRLYTLGAAGRLLCLNANTGAVCWSKDILADNDNITWGMAGSPLVDERMVIVNPGAQRDAAKGRAVVALDRETGNVVWQSGSTQAGYGSPMFATLGGLRQVLIFDAEELAGYDAASGKKLWSTPFVNSQRINVAQPLVLSGDRVLISHSYGGGSQMCQIVRAVDDWQVNALWKNSKLRCKFTSPVEHGGYVYGLDEGILACIDAQTGERKWKGERYGHGQILRHEELIVVFSESGFIALVKASPDGFAEIGRFSVFDQPKNWNPFALARGKIYVRNHKEMACVNLTD